MIEELLPLIDYVMVMTVDPGFSGQAYLTHVEGKIKQLAAVKERYFYQLMADGAISPAVMTRLSALGVDGFVLGTSALFGKEESYQELISIYKEEDQA
jgi:ribulose-phosphate 3-epimerase